MKYLKSIHEFLLKLPTPLFIISFVILMFISSVPFSFIAEYIESSTMNIDFNNKNYINHLDTKRFVINGILVPLIETLFFHIVIIIIIKKYLSQNNYVIILFSSLIFIIAHFYSISYMISIIGKSFLLSYSRVLLFYRKDNSYSILIISLIHSLTNIIGILITLI